MKTIKMTSKLLAPSKITASVSGRTLSAETYNIVLSAMKKAIRKDDRGSSGKSIERKK